MRMTVTILLLAASTLYARDPSGSEILVKVDENLSSSNRVFTSRMIIHGRRGSRTVASKSWAAGDKTAFTEYLAPAREKGTKMLKLDDRLWTYSPSTDRTIQISGHMLRQSLMGSDLSYEDVMEDRKLAETYAAAVTGTETIDNAPCWVITLTAETKDVAYHSRKLWVDREKHVPLRQELYAKSGKLLKRMEMSEIESIEGRWFAKKMHFKDVLKTGKGTEFLIESIKFDQDIPTHIFSKASLRK